MQTFFHSVRLDEEKCKGCTNCIKRCPTQAIRVRNGKAVITAELCIDCGECIKICPHHAKYAEWDPIERMNDFKYRVALPAPTLYGQFNNLDDSNYVLTALKEMGFDDIFEVSKAAELISDATRRLMEKGELKTPIISSACPAIIRLIRVGFPRLLPNVLPLISPMEHAARLAREKAIKDTGLPSEDIGIFFITPCPAKITAIRQPITIDKSNVDCALAIKDVYPALLKNMNKLDTTQSLASSGIIGVSWASSNGEASALLRDNYLAADGMENVMNVLEELEDDKLDYLDFVELNACTGGCVGGVLSAANPYIAKARLQRLRKYLPVSCNHLDEKGVTGSMSWDKPIVELPVLKLADNVLDAMHKMNAITDICSRLPGLDCGTCGAPSCRALAEDIVRGYALEQDCVFRLREELNEHEMEYLPLPFRKKVDGKEDQDE